MTLQIKRIYDPAANSDGKRILVDRLWPRGLSKESARIDFWARAIAPSDDLRRWYQHDPEKWPEFKRRYFAELDGNPDGLQALRAEISQAKTTLLFSSKELQVNNAVALQEYLQRRAPAKAPAASPSVVSAAAASSARQYWIGVVSKSHVQIGLNGGFTQLNHGKQAPLLKLKAGDGFAFYSPRLDYPDGEPCQCFTGIGRIKTGNVYQADMGGGFKPYRVDIEFLKAKEAAIKPLIEHLSFIKNKTHWGAAFRFGSVRVPAADFALIAAAMGRNFTKDFKP